jgi:acetoin utilization deacetylase AcuC-like enzyme
VFNDVAIAARDLQSEGQVERVVILDCDVHQGDGTAAVFQEDPSVFTFSIHGAKNFPFRKVPSDLDVGLDDGCEDHTYLEALEQGVRRALEAAQADLAIYIAGADPYEGDRLGRLLISKNGLAQRDQLVFDLCRLRDLPVATVMGGGYGKQVEHTVDIHFQTIRIAVEKSVEQ